MPTSSRAMDGGAAPADASGGAPLAGPAAPRLPWSPLLALFTAAFTAVLTELLPAGLLPAMSRSLDVPEGRIGLLVTGYAVASFLAAIPLTAALRALPRRTVLLAALAVLAVANAVTALSASYPLTFAMRLLAGAAGGTLWAMLAGYGARLAPPRLRGRAIAVVLAGITVALCAGVPAATALGSLVGWRAAFAGLTVVAAVLLLWVRFGVPDLPGTRKAERMPLSRVATTAGVPAVLCVTLFLLLGHQTLYTYLVPFAAHHGFGAAGPLLFVFGCGTLAGVWAAGLIADRFLRAGLVGALGAVAGSLAALGATGQVPAALVAAVAVWGAAFGAAPTLIQTALVAVSGPRDAEVATALQTTVYNAGIAGGSSAGALLLERAGPGALPWQAAGLVAVALLVGPVVGRRLTGR